MKRYHYIDYTKGIGILLIMLAHVIQNFPPLGKINSFICTFHVPIFFLVSGFLMDNRHLQNGERNGLLKKRAKELLIPYIIFSLFNSILKFTVLLLFGKLSLEIIKEEMIQLLVTGNGSVWYLMTLFLIEFIYITQLSRIRKGSRIIFTILMILCLTLPYLFRFNMNCFGIVGIRVIAGIGYYLFGVVLYRLRGFVECATRKFCWVPLFLGGFVAWFFLQSEVNFFNGKFHHMAGSLLCSLILSLFCLTIMISLDQIEIGKKLKKFLSYYGQNSIVVMLVHPTLLLMVTYPFGIYLQKLEGIVAYFVAIMVFVILIIAEIPFIFLLNRYLPFAIGRTKTVKKR